VCELAINGADVDALGEVSAELLFPPRWRP